jgi:MATE family multidrug resistance protein
MNTRPLAKYTPGGIREVLKISTPLLISMGSHVMMQFCDRMFLAWSSPIYLQAAMPAGVLAFTLCCWFMELAGYSNTFVAQHHGAGQPIRCSRSTGQGILIALATWIPMLLLIIPGTMLIEKSGHPPAAIEQEIVYFRILMLGSVALPLGAAMSSFFTGRGDTMTTMWVHIIGNAVNIVLDYAMIFGKWGFPEMGIRGAAWATVISSFIGPAILLGLFLSRRYDEKYATRKAFRPDRVLLKKIMTFGVPAATTMLMDVSAFAVFVMVVGSLGGRSLTANNAAFSINHIVFMPLLGFGIAASTLVGKYQGMRESGYAARAARTAWQIASIYMLFFAITFVVFPRFYLSFFTKWGSGAIEVEDILPLGRQFLLMMAIWGLFDAANLVLAGALKGAGDTKFVMWYSLGMAWGLWVPVQLILAKVFHVGIVGHWAWLCTYIAILSLGYATRFLRGKWKEIEMIGAQPPEAQPPLTGTPAADSPVP